MKMVLKFNNKSQIIVLACAFLFLIFLYIYSLETMNSYINMPPKTTILQVVADEVCYLAYRSSGEDLDLRLKMVNSSLLEYCNSEGLLCSFDIIPYGEVPPLGNWSLLNYSYYNFSLFVSDSTFNFTREFKC